MSLRRTLVNRILAVILMVTVTAGILPSATISALASGNVETTEPPVQEEPAEPVIKQVSGSIVIPQEIYDLLCADVNAQNARLVFTPSEGTGFEIQLKNCTQVIPTPEPTQPELPTDAPETPGPQAEEVPDPQAEDAPDPQAEETQESGVVKLAFGVDLQEGQQYQIKLKSNGYKTLNFSEVNAAQETIALEVKKLEEKVSFSPASEAQVITYRGQGLKELVDPINNYVLDLTDPAVEVTIPEGETALAFDLSTGLVGMKVTQPDSPAAFSVSVTKEHDTYQAAVFSMNAQVAAANNPVAITRGEYLEEDLNRIYTGVETSFDGPKITLSNFPLALDQTTLDGVFVPEVTAVVVNEDGTETIGEQVQVSVADENKDHTYDTKITLGAGTKGDFSFRLLARCVDSNGNYNPTEQVEVASYTVSFPETYLWDQSVVSDYYVKTENGSSAFVEPASLPQLTLEDHTPLSGLNIPVKMEAFYTDANGEQQPANDVVVYQADKKTFTLGNAASLPDGNTQVTVKATVGGDTEMSYTLTVHKNDNGVYWSSSQLTSTPWGTTVALQLMKNGAPYQPENNADGKPQVVQYHLTAENGQETLNSVTYDGSKLQYRLDEGMLPANLPGKLTITPVICTTVNETTNMENQEATQAAALPSVSFEIVQGAAVIDEVTVTPDQDNVFSDGIYYFPKNKVNVSVQAHCGDVDISDYAQVECADGTVSALTDASEMVNASPAPDAKEQETKKKWVGTIEKAAETQIMAKLGDTACWSAKESILSYTIQKLTLFADIVESGSEPSAPWSTEQTLAAGQKKEGILVFSAGTDNKKETILNETASKMMADGKIRVTPLEGGLLTFGDAADTAINTKATLCAEKIGTVTTGFKIAADEYFHVSHEVPEGETVVTKQYNVTTNLNVTPAKAEVPFGTRTVTISYAGTTGEDIGISEVDEKGQAVAEQKLQWTVNSQTETSGTITVTLPNQLEEKTHFLQVKSNSSQSEKDSVIVQIGVTKTEITDDVKQQIQVVDKNGNEYPKDDNVFSGSFHISNREAETPVYEFSAVAQRDNPAEEEPVWNDTLDLQLHEEMETVTFYVREKAGENSDPTIYEYTLKNLLVNNESNPVELAYTMTGAKVWEKVLHFISFGKLGAEDSESVVVTATVKDEKKNKVTKAGYRWFEDFADLTEEALNDALKKDTSQEASNWKALENGKGNAGSWKAEIPFADILKAKDPEATKDPENRKGILVVYVTNAAGNTAFVTTDGVIFDSSNQSVITGSLEKIYVSKELQTAAPDEAVDSAWKTLPITLNVKETSVENTSSGIQRVEFALADTKDVAGNRLKQVELSWVEAHQVVEELKAARAAEEAAATEESGKSELEQIAGSLKAVQGAYNNLVREAQYSAQMPVLAGSASDAYRLYVRVTDYAGNQGVYQYDVENGEAKEVEFVEVEGVPTEMVAVSEDIAADITINDYVNEVSVVTSPEDLPTAEPSQEPVYINEDSATMTLTMKFPKYVNAKNVESDVRTRLQEKLSGKDDEDKDIDKNIVISSESCEQDKKTGIWTITYTMKFPTSAEYQFLLKDYLSDKSSFVNGVTNVCGNYHFVVDNVEPETTITLTEESFWKELLEKITFGIFSKEDTKYTVTFHDNKSGIDLGEEGEPSGAVSYLLARSESTEKANDLLQTVISEKDQKVQPADSELNWVSMDAGKITNGSSFTVDGTANEAQVLYVRIQDKAGNVHYTSSDGVLEDSIKPTLNNVQFNQKDLSQELLEKCYTSDSVLTFTVEDLTTEYPAETNQPEQTADADQEQTKVASGLAEVKYAFVETQATEAGYTILSPENGTSVEMDQWHTMDLSEEKIDKNGIDGIVSYTAEINLLDLDGEKTLNTDYGQFLFWLEDRAGNVRIVNQSGQEYTYTVGEDGSVTVNGPEDVQYIRVDNQGPEITLVDENGVFLPDQVNYHNDGEEKIFSFTVKERKDNLDREAAIQTILKSIIVDKTNPEDGEHQEYLQVTNVTPESGEIVGNTTIIPYTFQITLKGDARFTLNEFSLTDLSFSKEEGIDGNKGTLKLENKIGEGYCAVLDETAPDGKISISTKKNTAFSWSNLLAVEKLSFKEIERYFGETTAFSLIVSDVTSPIVKVQYLLNSDVTKNEDIIKGLDNENNTKEYLDKSDSWEDWAVEQDQNELILYKYSGENVWTTDNMAEVLYVRMEDAAGNVQYISSNGVLTDTTPIVVDSVQLNEDFLYESGKQETKDVLSEKYYANGSKFTIKLTDDTVEGGKASGISEIKYAYVDKQGEKIEKWSELPNENVEYTSTDMLTDKYIQATLTFTIGEAVGSVIPDTDYGQFVFYLKDHAGNETVVNQSGQKYKKENDAWKLEEEAKYVRIDNTPVKIWLNDLNSVFGQGNAATYHNTEPQTFYFDIYEREGGLFNDIEGHTLDDIRETIRKSVEAVVSGGEVSVSCDEKYYIPKAKEKETDKYLYGYYRFAVTLTANGKYTLTDFTLSDLAQTGDEAPHTTQWSESELIDFDSNQYKGYKNTYVTYLDKEDPIGAWVSVDGKTSEVSKDKKIYTGDVTFTFNWKDTLEGINDKEKDETGEIASGIKEITYQVHGKTENSGSEFDSKIGTIVTNGAFTPTLADNTGVSQMSTDEKARYNSTYAITLNTAGGAWDYDNVCVTVTCKDYAGNTTEVSKCVDIDTIFECNVTKETSSPAGNEAKDINGENTIYYQSPYTLRVTVTERLSHFGEKEQEAATESILKAIKASKLTDASVESVTLDTAKEKGIEISKWTWTDPKDPKECSLTVTFNGDYKYDVQDIEISTAVVNGETHKAKFEDNIKRSSISNAQEAHELFVVDKETPLAKILLTYNRRGWDELKLAGALTALRVYQNQGLELKVLPSVNDTYYDDVSPCKIEWAYEEDIETPKITNETLQKMNWIEIAPEAFTEIDSQILLNQDTRDYVYVRITDAAGNVSYYNTDGIINDGTVAQGGITIVDSENQPRSATGLPLYRDPVQITWTARDKKLDQNISAGLATVDFHVYQEIESTAAEFEPARQYHYNALDFEGGEVAQNQILYETSSAAVCEFGGTIDNIQAQLDMVDNAGNSSRVLSEVFSFDNVSPTCTVTYNGNPMPDAYYAAPVEVMVEIVEHNFDPSQTVIGTIANGGIVEGVSWSNNGDVHTAYLTLTDDYVDDYGIWVTSTDRAGNVMEPYNPDGQITFRVDQQNPAASISYSPDIRNIYINQRVTATITVTEHNFNPEATTVRVNGSAVSVNWSSSGQDVYTATYQTPGDGIYTVSMETADMAGNAFAINNEQKFTVDLTNPKVQVTYSERNAATQNAWFNENQTATITITDVNFDEGRVTATNNGKQVKLGKFTSAGGNSYKATYTFTEGNQQNLSVKCVDKANNNSNTVTGGIIHIDTHVPKAEIVDEGSGNVESNLKAFDNAQSQRIVIRCTDGEQNLEHVEVTLKKYFKAASSTLENEAEAVETYTLQKYEKPNQPADDYVLNGDIDDVISQSATGKDADGKYTGVIISQKSKDDGSWEYQVELMGTDAGSLQNVESDEKKNIVSGFDGVYELKVTVKDKAGNVNEECGDGDKKTGGETATQKGFFRFSLNRYGSAFYYDEPDSALYRVIGSNWYTKQEEAEKKDIVIHEVSSVELGKEPNIEIEGSKLSMDKKQIVSRDVTDQNKESWEHREYTISGSNFEKEGAYAVTLKSSQEGAKVNGPHELKVTYDKTAPKINVRPVDSDKQGHAYKEASIDVKVSVEEDLLEEVEVLKYSKWDRDAWKDGQSEAPAGFDDTNVQNGLAGEKGITQESRVEEIQTIAGNRRDSEFRGAMDSEYWKAVKELQDGGAVYTYDSSANDQGIYIHAVDLAGNETVVARYFYVNTNIFAVWFHNKAAFYGTIGGAAAVIAGGIVLFLFMKKKKREEDEVPAEAGAAEMAATGTATEETQVLQEEKTVVLDTEETAPLEEAAHSARQKGKKK